jgi:hypothetical protein
MLVCGKMERPPPGVKPDGMITFSRIHVKDF